MNASHAMSEGGTLTIEAHESDEAGQRWAVIRLTDTGIGMDGATLAQAFEPFYTTKGLEGSGLGLSMVQGFAEQSGGDVRIKSAKGQGTMVELRLPVAPPGSSFKELPSAPEKLQGSGRILLVDDAADVLATTTKSLERAGFEVVPAGTGPLALGLAAAGDRFDAIVTDYAMPGMSGMQLIEQIRVIQPELAAIVITGFTELNILGEAVEVVLKPFQRRTLVEAVLRAVNGSKARL
jgi:CheY-like chemotaxis protein